MGAADVRRSARWWRGVPAPLAIGTVELADGSRVKGFLCEDHAVDGAGDITAHGGWRAYLGRRPDRPTDG